MLATERARAAASSRPRAASEAQAKLAKLVLDVDQQNVQLNGPAIASALKEQQALMARIGEIVLSNHASVIEMDKRIGALFRIINQRGCTVGR